MAMLDYQKAMEGKHWLKNQLLLSISEDLNGPVLKERMSFLLKFKLYRLGAQLKRNGHVCCHDC